MDIKKLKEDIRYVENLISLIGDKVSKLKSPEREILNDILNALSFIVDIETSIIRYVKDEDQSVCTWMQDQMFNL